MAVDVQVDFRNGYTPSGGGIQLQVFRDGVAVAGAAFAPNPLGREGGSTLTIDTTALPTGRNHFQVLPVSGGVNGPDSFFDIFVEIPVSIGLTVNNTPVTGTVNLTQPGKISASYQLLDSGGQPLAAAPRTEWSSSDDAIFGVYVDYSAFGTYPQLLPRANGDGGESGP